MRNESKIVYQDGEKISVLKGVIVKEDDLFIHLERNDGEYRIAKRTILRIENKRIRDETRS